MGSGGLGVVFGFRPTDKAPFRDERLRQAFSMTWDRDQYIDVMFNVKGFTDNGIPVRTSWSTSVQNNYFASWYLNPQGKDFGPNAKYFKRDVAEAKKLVAAAGFPNGLEVVSNISRVPTTASTTRSRSTFSRVTPARPASSSTAT